MARVNSDFLQRYDTLSSIDIQNTDIFVVDMINGFCKEGAMADRNIIDIVPHIKRLVSKFTNINKNAYFFVDYHEDDAIEFKSFPKHCLKDSTESEVVDELQKFVNQDCIIHKNSTNGFHEIDKYLSLLPKSNIENIIITGCCTDICVLQFALTLKTWLNANNLDIEVIIPLDCVDTYESGDAYHPAAQFNQIAITLLQQAGIQIYQTCVSFL